MKIGFAGAGGIACYFGTLFSRAGCDVTLFGRGEHIRTIAEKGLSITINGEQDTLPVRTVDTLDTRTLERVLPALDWLFITCKAHQSDVLIMAVKEFLSEKTQIITLQNGVDSSRNVSRLLPNKVFPGLSIRFVSHIVRPGEVEAKGDGYIIVGQEPCGRATALDDFVATLNQSSIDIRISENIRRELWRKLTLNNGVNPLCAVTGLDSGRALANPVSAALIDELMKEAALAASGDGICLTEEDITELRFIIEGLGTAKPSMQIDLENGRIPELDAICGAVIKYADLAAKNVPVTRTIASLLELKLTGVR
tara:strand:+ start:2282 stop:3211 length:930 start_codon:yes stop_codon:yes gene_type:complete